MDIRKIKIIHNCIENERTGSPQELALKIDTTERSVYNYIRFMKSELNAPIRYSKSKRTYYYESRCNINFIHNNIL